MIPINPRIGILLIALMALLPLEQRPLRAQVAAPLPTSAPRGLGLGARGAQVPFQTYEAEGLALRGARVKMLCPPGGEDSSPEMEASGRSYAQLWARGDLLQLKSPRAANALVIRHSIPDSATGGGTTATLSLYVNGQKRQSLALSSRHNWLYGDKGQNGQSNDPGAGQAHVFWDETRFFIRGTIKAGDVLKLQKDVGDNADFYNIDLLDLEAVPPALRPPPASTCLSVADFGALGGDLKDDSQAIQNCIGAARAQKKIVWMPSGTYFQSKKFVLDGVAVRGAGMWRTNLIGTVAGETWGGEVGFDLRGQGPSVSDLSINCPVYTRRGEGAKPLTGEPTRFRVENVWVSHTNVGLWMNGSDGVIRGCRIRGTYADGINLNNGASNNLIEQNHVRGCGDDGIAILSETEHNKPLSKNNTVRLNTVSAIWWGHNCDIAGGSGHRIENNLFADNAKMGCFTINQPGAYPMHPLSDTVIRLNTILRGGGNFAWQKRGAVWLYAGSTTISGVTFEDNLIQDSIFRALHLTGSGRQSILFRRNTIQNPGEAMMFIDAESNGEVIFDGNALRGALFGQKLIENEAKSKIEMRLIRNSWQ